ncbi:MAG: hypothetical protein ACLFQ3_06610 [Thiohalorhabdus sp.]
MSGRLPTDLAMETIDFTSVDPTLVSTSQSGGQYVRKVGGQRWKATVRFTVMSHADRRRLSAFLARQRGAYETWEIILPTESQPEGPGGGTPLVDGSDQTGDEVDTDGWPEDTTVLYAGDKVLFGGHAKVYEVTEDVTSDSEGAATLPIYPPLRQSPEDDATVTYEDVPFTVRLVGGQYTMPARPGRVYRPEIEIREAL